MEVWADDSDVLRDGFVAAEHLPVHGAVGPAGSEFLAHASVVGPAGIGVGIGFAGADFDGDGGRSEDIAVPIYDAACGTGVDGDFYNLGRGLGSPDLRWWFGSRAPSEQHRAEG